MHSPRTLALSLAAAIGIAGALPSTVARAAPPVQIIHVIGMHGTAGHVVAMLFRATDRVPAAPFLTVRGAIHDSAADLALTALPAGDYAVIVFHDVNDNGVLDHNALHLPAEPLGFSGGFALSLLSGMPTFEKLRVHLPTVASATQYVATIDVGSR